MKSSRITKRKKKKDRTWAEAATLAIQQSTAKMLGIRPILHTIYNKKLKEISMNKAAENVLTTMLNHHAQLPNCPFYRVKGKMGLYALKDAWLKKNGDIILKPESSISSSEDLLISEERVPAFNDIVARENHTYSIQGKPFSPESRLPSNFRKKVNSITNNSPQRSNYEEETYSQKSNCPNQTISRNINLTSRITSLHPDHSGGKSPKIVSYIDLETPSSILVNANMRALVNKDTFSMLPSSYQYKLTGYLPQCDQILSDKNGKDNKIFVPSTSALTNEFFTQAVQEWKDRLTDGEFTRETQSRIVQEIAKERGKIDPWKEKFFEEYYGQNRQVPSKRLRSRSHNLAAAEVGHQLRDLGMEAQLELFEHLKPEVKKAKDIDANLAESDLEISDPEFEDYDDLPLEFIQRKQRLDNLKRETTPPNTKTIKIGLDDFQASNKTLSKPIKVRNYKPVSDLKKQLPTGVETQLRLKESLDAKIPPSLISPIVMKPSGYLTSNCNNLTNSNNLLNNEIYSYSDGETKNDKEKFLNIRKHSESGSAVIADHSYTSVLWQKGNQFNSPKEINNEVPNPQMIYPKENVIALRTSSKQLDLVEKMVTSSTLNFPNKNTTTSMRSATTPLIKKNNSIQEHTSSLNIRPSTSEVQNTAKLFNYPTTHTNQVPGLPEKSSKCNADVVLLRKICVPNNLDTLKTLNSSGSEKLPDSAVNIKTTTTQPNTTSLNATIQNTPLTKQTVTVDILPKNFKFSSNVVTKFVNPASTVNSATHINFNKQENLDNPSTVAYFSTTTITKPFLNPVAKKLLSKDSFFKKTSVSATNLLRFSDSSSVLKSTNHTSPLIPARMQIPSMKRSHQSPTLKTSTNHSAQMRWGSSISPSPIKKTRTLAEIKAQIKANKAAATRPESQSFCVPASPVYFPLKTSVLLSNGHVLPNQTTVPAATYVRLSTTTTVSQLDQIRWSGPKSLLAGSPKMHIAVSLSGQISCPPKISPLQNSGFIPKEFISSVANKDNWKCSLLSSPTNPSKGKITLKIKTAGQAILRKVDADVIKKGIKEAESTSDEEKSEEEEDKSSSSENTDSDNNESPIKTTCRYMSSNLQPVTNHSKNISKSSDPSSDSGSDLGEDTKRWVPNTSETSQIREVQFKLSNSRPPCLSTTSNTTLVKPPIFGIPPYNIDVKSNQLTLEKGGFSGNSLFQTQQSSISFFPKKICNDKNFKKVNNTLISGFVPNSLTNKYRSTSKGKSIQQMQELARSNRIHSDDSSENEDDRLDSSFSTSTASENDKFTDSDASDSALKSNFKKRPFRSRTYNKNNNTQRSTAVQVLPSSTVVNK